MADDIKKIIKDSAKATAKEIRHEFDIVIEDLEKGTLQAIREELGTHTQQLERLGPMEETLDQVRVDVDAIKATLDQVNLVELKEEVTDPRMPSAVS